VIHGSEDPLVRIRNGRNLARIISGARFVVVDGMGHDLPQQVWAPVVAALAENFGVGRKARTPRP
jgi:pimeloyl-ACP methyl ester carboxylesterase